MTQLTPQFGSAIAFYDWGSWKANCPNPACTNAMEIQPDQTTFHCWYTPRRGGTPQDVCGTMTSIQWPPNRQEIEEELASLPPSQRSWTP